MGMVMMRKMRRSLAAEVSFSDSPPTPESFSIHTYHAVIQQLKQQKHELLSLQLVERRRAKTSENISAAVLSNLSCGVLFLTPNGLVRQANAAAKQILGFASPGGMSIGEVFRDAEVEPSGTRAALAETLQINLHENTPMRRVTAAYMTPARDERMLDISLTSVKSPGGETLGAACVINDQTEMAQIRRQQELRGELSAEMALDLRGSLATISGYAQQLAASRDAEFARQLATDIATEAAHLDHTIGGFLAGARVLKATART